MSRHVGLAEGLSKLALGILHPMTFINHYVLPLDFAQGGFVIENVFVSCQHHIVFFILQLLSDDRSLVPFSLVADHTYRRRPFFEL